MSLSSGLALTDQGSASIVDSKHESSLSASTATDRRDSLAVPRGAVPNYRGTRRSTTTSGSSSAPGGRASPSFDAQPSGSMDVAMTPSGPNIAHLSHKQSVKPARRKSITKKDASKLPSKRRRRLNKQQ